MHPSAAFTFARVAHEYSRWRAVAQDRRSDAPAWWWGPAMAVRNSETPMPLDIAAPFALGNGARYAQAAELLLDALGDQQHQPWPDHFPEKYVAKAEDPAPSAEPAAQAALAAVVPIA